MRLQREATAPVEGRPEGRLEEARAEVGRWAAELAPADPAGVIAWALERWGKDVVLCTSFQAEGMVILDLARDVTSELRVFTLDTGRLPLETYDHIDRVRHHYNLEIEVIFPDAVRLQELVRRSGPNLFYSSHEARLECCRVRKIEPLRRALSPYSAWLAGLRRDQTSARQDIAKVELDELNDPHGGLVKVNPLADWSHEQVWSHIRERRVPYHPLYDRGYRSIGCAPCTRPSRPDEDARAGRWWWEQDDARECGLHVLPGGAG